MGGLHSGRKRRHTCIDDCLEIDTAWLRKQKMLPDEQRPHDQAHTIEWRKWTERDFTKRTQHTYRIYAYLHTEHKPVLLLSYQVEQTGESGNKKLQEHTHPVALVSTPCNYGGSRWWFACPDCSSRVRVLYINPKGDELASMRPLCRNCLELHYASQMASYIERHKTYERHLLANYGLYWASHRYDFELKEHYLEMTPELWQLRMKSVVSWNIHLLKAVIRCDLLILRSDLAKVRSLRSEADRQMYLDHMREKERDLHTSYMVRLLHACIQQERLLYQINTSAMPDDLFTTYAYLTDMSKELHLAETTQSQKEIETTEQKIVSLEKLLKEVNKREKKMAA